MRVGTWGIAKVVWDGATGLRREGRCSGAGTGVLGGEQNGVWALQEGGCCGRRRLAVRVGAWTWELRWGIGRGFLMGFARRGVGCGGTWGAPAGSDWPCGGLHGTGDGGGAWRGWHTCLQDVLQGAKKAVVELMGQPRTLRHTCIPVCVCYPTGPAGGEGRAAGRQEGGGGADGAAEGDGGGGGRGGGDGGGWVSLEGRRDTA